MLAASAIYNDLSNLVTEASPVDTTLRQIIFEALKSFEEAEDFLVLDEEGTIRDEYERNMPFNSAMHSQEYGLLVLQHKLDFDRVNFVTIEVIEANGERIAKLTPELEAIVTDREDRKWIACAQAHPILHTGPAPIVYGAESDWFVIQDKLAAHGVSFRRLLPDAWYVEKCGNG